MTTAWSHVVRGQLVRAFRANAGGALLGVVTVMLAPWVLVSGLRGRWVGRPLSERMTLAMVFTLFGVTLVDWVVRLYFQF
jgi:hypothetical protein